jgi:uncharacterized protein YcgI (DUF1989 family)
VSGPTPNARDLLALAASKHGLGRVDLGPNISLFKGVRVDETGDVRFDGVATASTCVELRAEMDVLVLMANTPHPLDDRDDYAGTAVRTTAWRGGTPGPDDPFRLATPERARAFLNTDEFLTVTNP